MICKIYSTVRTEHRMLRGELNIYMDPDQHMDGLTRDHHGLIPDVPGATAREWLTVEQAADYLQLSQSSIRSYIRQNRLEARRIAGKRKVLIHRSELLKLLEPARNVANKEPES
jgi:excisionase family DNA binding protein